MFFYILFFLVVFKAQINIDRATTYQNIEGFGGSMTGSVSYILDMLPKSLQDAVYT